MKIELENAVVYQGSNLDVLPTLPDNSVDSIVTDPPYELGFMGKSWDNSGIAYSVELWTECMRVLKPGGHLLAFGGSRTWHRLAVAIEDAGFEMRDSIAWLYGSGFPKSLNVSKAIDNLLAKPETTFNLELSPDEELFCAWMREHSGLTEAKSRELLGSARFITGVVEIVNTATKDNPRMGRRAMVPTTAAWEKIKPILATTPPDWVEALVKEPPKPGIEHPSEWNSGKGEGTSGSNEWAGWGTALKPAFEPVVVARKPLEEKTVAANVLKYGTGGLNIDGSRIGTEERINQPGSTKPRIAMGDNWNPDAQPTTAIGRWPANIILDPYTAELLDEQSGISASKASNRGIGFSQSGVFGSGDTEFDTVRGINDTGGASRFFYVAKASKKDRNEGLDDLEAKLTAAANFRPNHMEKALEGESGNPFGRFQPVKNFHPTVKPTSLMEYLIKLVTPPNGTVLDPFTGSGSTGKAALLSGFKFIGIELTEEYLPIIEGRLKWASEQASKKEEEKNEVLF